MLPPFNDKGDLPPGIHLSSMEEIHGKQKGMEKNAVL